MRLIAAYLVVAAHCWHHYFAREALYPIFRIAVPTFFIISGFFLYHPDSQILNQRINKRLKKTIILWIVGIISFMVSTYFRSLVTGEGLDRYAPDLCTPIFTVVYCHSLYGFYLWFLIALIEGFLAMKITSVWQCDRWFVSNLKWYIPCFLITLGVIIRKYMVLIFPLSFDAYYLYPPVLFLSWPFIYLGYIIRRDQDSILSFFQKKQICLILLIIVFSVISIWEGIKLPRQGDNYLSTLPLVLSLFFLLLSRPSFGGKIIAWLGQRYALWIYLFHNIVYVWTEIIVGDPTSIFLHPIFQFSITLGLCLIVDYIISKIVRRSSI